MAPNTKETIQGSEDDWYEEQPTFSDDQFKSTPPRRIVWRNVFLFVFLHSGAVYGLYLAFTAASYKTLFFAYLLHFFSGLGVTAGAHRLWAHKAYKAILNLRIFLMLCNCLAFQNDLLEWCRDHRVHHKFSETPADPHNARRGFFFAHIGWLLVRKHPDVIEKGKTVDLSDLWADPVIRFQRRHYLKLIVVMWLAIPTLVPYLLWGETLWNAYFVCVLARYTWTLNVTWLVNSAAHLWGDTPYDETINSRENILVSFGAGGEGWHNYHHTFPMDYKAAEIPYFLNMTTAFIDTWNKLGWTYDLKSVPKEIIEKRRMRTGDKFGHGH